MNKVELSFSICDVSLLLNLPNEVLTLKGNTSTFYSEGPIYRDLERLIIILHPREDKKSIIVHSFISKRILIAGERM